MFINKRTNNCTYIQIYIPQFINIDEKVRRRESKRDRIGGGVARNASNASAQVCICQSISFSICFVFVFVDGVVRNVSNARSIFVYVLVSLCLSAYVSCQILNSICFRMNPATETVAAALMDRSRLLSRSLR